MPTILGSNFASARDSIIPGFGGTPVRLLHNNYHTITTTALSANTMTQLPISVTGTLYNSGYYRGAMVYCRWVGEVTSLWDMTWGFYVTSSANGTEYIGRDYYNQWGVRNVGLTCGGDSYAVNGGNDASTGQQMDFWYLWGGGSNYSGSLTFGIWTRAATARTVYTNRTVTDTTTTNHERFTSAIYVYELGSQPI